MPGRLQDAIGSPSSSLLEAAAEDITDVTLGNAGYDDLSTRLWVTAVKTSLNDTTFGSMPRRPWVSSAVWRHWEAHRQR